MNKPYCESIEALEQRVIKLLSAQGVPEDQGLAVAQCFVMADACGIHSHGIAILPAHLERLQRGAYNLSPRFELITKTHAFARIDSDNALGPYSAKHCMEMAMENARVEGMFAVNTLHCNTYGPAFYFTYLAARQGLIGITFCNSPAAMPAWGGTDRLLGTNPLAIAIPGKNQGPILFDMATSKAAKSKINEARLAGDCIPEDWALDEKGQRTTDPLAAIKGLILPMADHKGYGLALCIDMLAGVLSGAAYSTDVKKFYSEDSDSMNVGQMFIAIDPRIVLDHEFYEKVDDYIRRIHQSAALPGQKPRFPGEGKLIRYQKAKQTGVELDVMNAGKVLEMLKA